MPTRAATPANAFPQTHPLAYHGGPVMQSESVTYAIFWEPPKLQDGTATHVSATYNALITQYFNDINGSNLYAINTQYYQTAGSGSPPQYIVNSSTLGGTWLDTSAYPASGCTDAATPHGCLTDSQIQAEVTKAMAQNNWINGLTDLFFVFTAWGEGSCDSAGDCAFSGGSHPYCAYHGVYPSSASTAVLYANMPYTGTSAVCAAPSSPNNDSDADSTINVLSHEHMEAVTDPLVGTNAAAWYDSSGAEIGDKCAWKFGTHTLDGGLANVLVNGHYYIVQQEWSNVNAGCTLIGPSTSSSAGVFAGSEDGFAYALEATTGALRWRVPSPSNAYYSAVTAGPDLVYAGGGSGNLLAISPTSGTVVWTYSTSDTSQVYTTLASTTTVYLGTSGANLYALNASTGALLWHVATDYGVYGLAQLGNVVYVSTGNETIYALNASTGAAIWQDSLTGTYVTVANGVLYATLGSSGVSALNPTTGAVLWNASVGADIASVVIGGLVYAASSAGPNSTIYALNAASGSQVWAHQLASAFFVTGLGADGNTVYAGAQDGNLYALDGSSGVLRWKYQTGNVVGSAPVVVSGTVYVGSCGNNVDALNGADGSLLWSYTTGGPVCYPESVATNLTQSGGPPS